MASAPGIPGESQEALLADLARPPGIASAEKLIRAAAEALGFTEKEVQHDVDVHAVFYRSQLRLVQDVCALEEKAIEELRYSSRMKEYLLRLKREGVR